MAASAAKRPTFKTGIQNLLPAVRFNGSNLIQTGNVGTTYSDQYVTMMMVANPTDTYFSGVFMFCNDPSENRENWQGTLGPAMSFKRSTTPNHSPEWNQGQSNNWFNEEYTLAVFTITRNGQGITISMYKNNTLLLPLARPTQGFNNIYSNLDTFRFGGWHNDLTQKPFYGDLFEFVYYDTVLSDADREANVAALMTKWGIT